MPLEVVSSEKTSAFKLEWKGMKNGANLVSLESHRYFAIST